jgi:16S rRNA (guanine966-N2)-methyltransferase
MRIVAGAFRGRRLHSPKGQKIRPTTDRVREAIFSIIAPYLSSEARVLDLFAGTGALGLEALSRGASQAVFVDQSPEAVRLIRSNVEMLGVQDRVQIIHGPVDQVVRRLAAQGETFHIIFMDPPYGKDHLEKTLSHLHPVAHPEALVLAERHVKDTSPAQCGEWRKTQERRYGDTVISFYERDFPR